MNHEGVVIDPSFNVDRIIKFAGEQNINLTQVWLTHAHYDHFAGARNLMDLFPQIKIGLHPADLFLLERGGLAGLMGIDHPEIFTPDLAFADNAQLQLGEDVFSVLHTPGHPPGHVVFYCAAASAAFCGDLI
ncbi:MAG: MBL fold metallo-hydrolase, partial [Anaerolineae bacterium]|nr:MBL fold metallo-hydrolase [Anaerolineae bacterium]